MAPRVPEIDQVKTPRFQAPFSLPREYRSSREFVSNVAVLDGVGITLNQKVLHSLETVKFTGGIFPYACGLFGLSIVSALISIPMLLIPVNKPELGLIGNLTYWLGYNSFVIFIYLLASYNRLSKMCHRTAGGSLPPLQVDFGWNARSVGVVASSMLVTAVIMNTIGLLVGKNAATSYNMMYLAPVSCTVSDVLFIFMLPEAERSVDVVKFLANQSALCGVPIFAVFGPILAQAFLPSVIASLIAIVVFPIMANSLQKMGRSMLESELRKVQFDCAWMETCVPVHLESLTAIAEMMLFPGATSIVVLCGIITVEAAQRTHDNIEYLRVVDAPEYSDLHSSDSEDVEAINDANDHRKNSHGLSFIKADAEQKAMIRQRARKFNMEAFSATYMKGVVQLTTLTCPVLFCILSWIITNYRNKKYYYVYECLHDGDELVAIEYAAINLGFQVIFFTIDIAFLWRHGLASVFVLICQSFVKLNWFTICVSIAFSCTVFTSCFLIKHDGIAVLENLLSDCEKT